MGLKEAKHHKTSRVKQELGDIRGPKMMVQGWKRHHIGFRTITSTLTGLKWEPLWSPAFTTSLVWPPGTLIGALGGYNEHITTYMLLKVFPTINALLIRTTQNKSCKTGRKAHTACMNLVHWNQLILPVIPVIIVAFCLALHKSLKFFGVRTPLKLTHSTLHPSHIANGRVWPDTKRSRLTRVVCNLCLVAILYALIMVTVWSLQSVVHLTSCKPDSHPCAKVACQLQVRNSVLETFIWKDAGWLYGKPTYKGL